MKENKHFSGSIVGIHVIADVVDIKNPFRFDNIEVMQKILHAAAKKAKLTVLGENWEKFQPQGCSGFLFLSESHISFHLSPEHATCWVDCFTCSGGDGAAVAMRFILNKFKPNMQKTKVQILDRSFKGF